MNLTLGHVSGFGSVGNGQIVAGVGITSAPYGLSVGFSHSDFKTKLTKNARSIGQNVMNYISKQSEKQWQKYYKKYK